MLQSNPKYMHPTSAATVAVMKANKRSDTKPEILIRKALHRLGYRFRKDLIIVTDGHKCRPDIVFTKKKLAVFVDGCFWHLCPIHGNTPKTNSHYWIPKLERNVQRDKLNTEALKAINWKVVRLWEHTPLSDSLLLIEKALKQ